MADDIKKYVLTVYNDLPARAQYAIYRAGVRAVLDYGNPELSMAIAATEYQ